MSRHRKNGFTLVELLVVIGIIGVLLSILLPSLSGAREQANLVVCQSNLSQIGKLIELYSSENHGLTPPVWMGDRGPGAGNDDYDVTYADTLTLLNQGSKRYAKAPFFSPYLGGLQPMGATPATSKVLNLEPDQDSAIFHDVDTPPVSWYPHSTAYVGNVRALGAVGLFDPLFYPSTLPEGYHPRDMGSIQKASESMMVWCGACDVLGDAQTHQGDTFNFGCFLPYPDGLDNYQMYYVAGGHNGLGYPTPASTIGGARPYLPAYYSNPIALGVVGAPNLFPAPQEPNSGGPTFVTLADLRAENQDAAKFTGTGASGYYGNGGYAVCYMRFRHMHNTVGNFLYCDFHVESKHLGDVVARDVCLNPVLQK